MRTIIIDPETKTVGEIQINTYCDDLNKEFRSLLQCESFTTGAWLRGGIEKGFEMILVSDDMALVSATADVMCAEGENVLEIEADLYNLLAVNCAEKQKLALGFRKRIGK